MTRVATPDILGNIMAATATPAATLLALSAIVNDGGTQMRAGMNADTVKEYEDALTDSEAWPFPPVIVYHDGARYWLADGFHRLNAAHRSGKFQQIPADIKPGTRRDAVLYAAGANASHGLRRTKADMRRSVEMLLLDEEWGKWSNREIARRCNVSESSVRNIRAEMESTAQIAQSTTRTGADGRTIDTANIGTNRPIRLFVGDLKGLVAKWMGENWQHAWPDNPSHTNGEFWQKLTAWMHENVRETWQEGDLKEAIKAIHYQATAPVIRQPVTQYMAVWQLEGVVREVYKEVYRDQEQPYAIRDMRQGAQQRTGRFWLLCAKTINSDNWRHPDLAQAINNVAEHFAQQRQPPPSQPAPDADLHAGAGRTAAPPMTVQELVADLDGYLDGISAADITAAARGANNKALDTARQCLIGSYRATDLYRALDRLALQRGAPQPVQQVNGDLPLPDWAEDPDVQGQRIQEERNERARQEFSDAGIPCPSCGSVGDWSLDRCTGSDFALRVDARCPKCDGSWAWIWSDSKPLSAFPSVQLGTPTPATVADVVEVHGEPTPVDPVPSPEPAEVLPVSQRTDYESDEWYTPAEYIDAARQVMGGIDLDPASSELAQTVVQAAVYLTKFDNGLGMVRWLGQRIWLNPPYSNPGPWIEKIVREHHGGPFCTEAVVLVNNATETSWFQMLLEEFPVCLPARRIAFWRHDHANVGARQGQAFFYLGPNVSQFQEIFRQFGPILRRV